MRSHARLPAAASASRPSRRRLSSEFFPWCTEYELKDLPDYEAIAAKFQFAGDLARAWKMRLTFHPSHFVKLAAQEAELLRRSKHELEVHSQVGCPAPRPVASVGCLVMPCAATVQGLTYANLLASVHGCYIRSATGARDGRPACRCLT